MFGFEQRIDFDAVRESVNLVDIISRYCNVPPHGNRSVFRMPCPLHNGEADNFIVNVSDQVYHCFVCKASGNVLQFVAAIENLSIVEAAKKIAEETGYRTLSPMTTISRQTEQKMETWRELRKSPPPLEGDPPFKLQPLFEFRDFSLAAIMHWGLKEIEDDGSHWGFGIYIPLHDELGNLVGYAIRQPEGVEPKYLNSKGLRKKGIIYGLHQNLEDIRRANSVILVEGQLDAISFWQRGIKNVCAVMGSHLSQYQALKLLPAASTVYLSFDGDDAGRQGAIESYKKWKSAFDIRTIELPDGKDPATLNEEELNEVKNRIQGRKDLE